MNKPYAPMGFIIEPNLLPVSGRMLLTGENGTGKSAIALYMAACLVTGTPLFGFTHLKHDDNEGNPVFPINPVNRILYVDYEIPHAIRKDLRLAPLINTLGTSWLSNVAFPEIPSDCRLEGAEFRNLLAIAKDFKPDLTIIDPLSASHNREENKAEMRMPLAAADQIIDQTGSAIMIVHHASTKKTRTPGGRIVEKGGTEQARGSSTITDWADFNLLLTNRTPGKSKIKTLELDFAKTRYSQILEKRYISADIEHMIFKPV